MSTGNESISVKKYYTIGEVSELVGVKQTVLRFWEEEFEQLRPIKNKFGHRAYTDEDIAVIIKIKNLLYESGLTIRGAKSVLDSKNSSIKSINYDKIKKELYLVKNILKKGKEMKNRLDVIKKLEESGNSHILYFYETLSEKEKNDLLDEVGSIDFDLIKKLFEDFKNQKKEPQNLKPADYYPIEITQNNRELKDIAEVSLRKGEVALLTVAGGQGSRLGYDHPKGCFPITPVRSKSLFQIFAEKIKFYSDYYKTQFYWYIMTSKENYDETLSFFKDNNFFSLNKEHIVFFKQGSLPTLTMDGKLILKDKNALFLNPDGHGGILNALSKNNIYQHMVKNGVKYLSYFQVDNPLTKIIDPYFLGCHIKENSKVSSKVIKKAYPEEKLGVICKKGQANCVIEYSDLSKEDMYAKDEKGNLKYLMGSIAIHIFNVEFLARLAEKLPVHFAVKKIKGYLSDGKGDFQISECEGVKFESFIFDVIPMADISIFFETTREVEFSPLKNREGSDSIQTCREAQSLLFLNWLKEAKLIDKDYDINVEISPLFAPDVEIFLNKVQENFDKLKNVIYDRNNNVKENIYIE